jgi:glycosyltransferase involved in cell wall biosynthesis
MRIAGFTFIRNGIKFDYPFLESLRSLLPLCDEVVVAVGHSDDATLEAVESLRSPKIVIIPTAWDESVKTGGAVLSRQTNIALDHVRGDWGLYLQGDEVLHEKDYNAILKTMDRYKDDRRVEGLLFSYYHFYGSYRYIGKSRRWYRREIRAVRPDIGIQSWGDAQGFRLNGCKLHVRPVDAAVYHYGWVKNPSTQQLKQKNFSALWHSERWIEEHIADVDVYDYTQGGSLQLFAGDHPQTMQLRVAGQNWEFRYDEKITKRQLKDRTLDWIEKKTGIRPGEYKNYILL